MGGQLLMVFPEKQTIFVTTADTQGIAGGNQLIYDAFYRNLYDNIQETPSSGASSFGCRGNAAQQALIQRLDSLAIAPLSPYADGSSWGQDVDPLRCFDGNSYRIVDTFFCPCTPKREYVSGFTNFSFIFSKTQKGLIQFTFNQWDYTLSFGLGKMETGIFPIYDLAYAASGAWLDAHTLYVRFHIIDRYVGSVHIQFYFGENDVTIFMKKVEESCFAEFNGHFYGIKEKNEETIWNRSNHFVK
jgi:hypothetical protein